MRVPRVAQRGLVVAIVANTFCMAGTVAADTTPSPPNPPTGTSGPPTLAMPAADGGVIAFNCKLKVDNAHYSKHFIGTINVEVNASCNPAVPLMTMLLALWRVGTPPAITAPVSISLPVTGTTTLYAQTAIPCIPGTYYGAADAVVIFPLGATVQVGAMGDKSADQPITCGQ